MNIENKKWVLKKRPVGYVKDSDFELVTEMLPEIKDGEILLENIYLSFDPTQRGWLNDEPGYLPPVQIDEVVRSGGIGRVLQSKNPEYKVGELTFGLVGWQTHCLTKPEAEDRFRIIPELLPIPTMLNVMGSTGITAYYGLIELGNPQPGETVLVSGAAGATGSVVVQIAKLKGCHVIGIAGGKEKCDWLKGVGADEVIDYKNSDIHQELPKVAKNGIDVYFDNVGGEILDAALIFLRRNARVILCGAISQYNNKESIKGPKNYLSLLVNRASIKGMIVFDYVHKYEKAISEISGWIEEGKITVNEDIYEGIHNFRSIFLKLFNGDKMGKLILKIKPK